MATYKLKNWQDERGSELYRAKMLLKAKPIKLIEISKLSKIPYQTIRKYSSGYLNLDNSDWSHINKLAQVWDMVQVSKTIPQDSVADFQALLHEFFSASRKEYPGIAPMLKRMEQIVTSDPVAVAELYKANKKTTSDKS